VAGRIRSIEKCNDLIGYRNHDLPACSILPQQTTLLRAPRMGRYEEGSGVVQFEVPLHRTHGETEESHEIRSYILWV
jgi:hypothetical protein